MPAKRTFLFATLCLPLLGWAGWKLQHRESKSDYSGHISRADVARHEHETIVEGRVLAEGKPVSGAIVRVQATPNATISNGAGKFRLRLSNTDDNALQLTAWAKGFFCGGPVECRAGQRNIEFNLRAHAAVDHPNYQWKTYHVTPGTDSDEACSTCHSRGTSGLMHPLPGDEWLRDAHSQSAVNPRFLSMYRGCDLSGNQSPLTRHARDPDYGLIPLPVDGARPYYGPGYKLDFPEHAGNCATCHVPVAASKSPYDTDPTQVNDAAAEGVSCDLCHKIWDVRVEPDTGLPFPNRPGVLSMEFRRPPEGEQFFAGPYDDVTAGDDTYLPLQHESRLCAACHFGVFWDTVVYNSFGEWLSSPFSDPVKGQSCQDCHMPRSGSVYCALPEKGGLQRDSKTVFSHQMTGASDTHLLQNSVSMRVDTHSDGDKLVVRIAITNDQTGHHVPTGSPLRHLILSVKTRDSSGTPLRQVNGPKLPAWTDGKSNRDGYAGQPGKTFAKILEEVWTGTSPTGAYWNPTRIVRDNRLAAGSTDVSRYTFAKGAGHRVKLDVQLFFRRAFKPLMEQKGWTDDDVLMERTTLWLTWDGDDGWLLEKTVEPHNDAE
jgi:hypothetical protein